MALKAWIERILQLMVMQGPVFVYYNTIQVSQIITVLYIRIPNEKNIIL